YHYLMIATGLMAGILAILENLLLGVMERAREFGVLQAVGWRLRDIMLAVLWEGAALGGLGGVLGLGVGSLLFWGISGKVLVNLEMVSALTIASATLLGMLVALYPAIRAVQLTPVQVLAGPAERVRAFPRWSVLRWGAALVITGILLVGVAGLGGRKAVVQQIFLSNSPAQAPLHPALQAVSTESALRRVAELTQLGPRYLGNAAEQSAAAYIRQHFQTFGLEVSQQAVPLTGVTFYLPGSQGPLLHLPGQEGRVLGLAYHGQSLQEGTTIKGEALFLPVGAPYPPAEAVAGKIVLAQEADPRQRTDSPLQRLVAHYGFPAPYLAAVSLYLDNDKESKPILTQMGLQASIPVGENVVAVLPGRERLQEEIWLVARIDSNTNSPGADENGSGIGVLLELARIFAERGSPVTLRFLTLTGTATGLEGATAYLLSHESELSHVRTVLEFDQVGAWEKLLLGTTLNGPDPNGSLLSTDQIQTIRAGGLAYLTPLWTKRLDVDRADLSAWLEAQLAHISTQVETPPSLLNEASQAAEALGITVEKRASPCMSNQPVFLYRDLPALLICGQGNGLAGSEFDSADTLHADKLHQAVALGYQLILQLER
ncbi:MAG: M28 family peptidase, partial [Anaerolineaceae bacterium]|nr:M28 family peptidase [Anaerolineaceae bacterium]